MEGNENSVARAEAFVLTSSRGFPEWLAATGGSLAFTTYQAGKIFFLGVKPDGGLSVFERTFPRAMGLAVGADGRSLALATHYQIHRFDNVLPAGQADADGFDAVFAPHAAWVTGDLDVHDIGFGADGRPVVRQHPVRLHRDGERRPQLQAALDGRPSSRGWPPRTAATSTAWRWRTDGRDTSPPRRAPTSPTAGATGVPTAAS